ncbi:hypothetical protein BCR35DRAFT_356278 [Leucosporidium creatinivorum]|uniref:DUF7918 domain-containing protein n=1 Tax=Leucosporidium creatinivorum TaxID=106004 RepID=A0A1Y2CFK6_9BASI|nr:hypothetical protein BCR35DRAFT_356278 [Leucosporidium creatinivorum]
MAKQGNGTQLSTGQFAASVLVHNKPLPVYQVEHDEEERKTTCYIEAHGGGHFSVVHLNNGDKPGSEEDEDEATAWDVSTYLDGVKVGGVVYGIDSIIYNQPKGEARQQSLKGHQDSSTTYQPFIFAKLRLTDDSEKACTDSNRLNALGTIQVRVSRVKANSLKECTSEAYFGLNDIETYEKSNVEKKQLSYQTKLGPSLASVPESRITFERIDPVDKPYLTFEFRYRSKSLLQKLDILSHESSGLSSVSGDESATLKKETSPDLGVDTAPKDDKKPTLPPSLKTKWKPKLKPLNTKPNFNVEGEKDVKPNASKKKTAASKDKGKGKLKAQVIQIDSSDEEDKKSNASTSKPKPTPASAPKKQSTFKPLLPKAKPSTSSAPSDHIVHYISDSDDSSAPEEVPLPSIPKPTLADPPAPKRKVSVADPAVHVKGQRGTKKGSTSKGKGKRPPSSSDEESEQEDKKPVAKSAPKKKKVKRDDSPPPPVTSPTSPKTRKTFNSTSTPIATPQLLTAGATPEPKTKPQSKKRPLSPTDAEDLHHRIASLPSYKIHKKVKEVPEPESGAQKVDGEGEERKPKLGGLTEKAGEKVEGDNGTLRIKKVATGNEVDEFAMLKTGH